MHQYLSNDFTIVFPERDEDRKWIVDATDWEKQDKKAEIDGDEYKRRVLEGAIYNWPEALEVLGYSSYGGNSVFDCDWELARDCFLRLIDIQEHPSPFFYNSLGYIYYYGRCSQGVPEYEKAFQYFAVGAFNKIFESEYKIADMLIAGEGVPKNTEAAFHLLEEVYWDCKDLFMKEVFDCKFADAALRLGSMYEQGVGVPVDHATAYLLYLQASLAIEKRRSMSAYTGDAGVEKRIQEGLARTKDLLPDTYFKESFMINHPMLLKNLLDGAPGMDVCVASKDGAFYLVAKRIMDDQNPKKALFTIPELDYCVLSDTVVMKVENLKSFQTDSRDLNFCVTDIIRDEEEDLWTFVYLDRALFSIQCDGFSFEK